MGLALGRNVLLARILPMEEMAVGAILMLVLATIDQIFDTGVAQFLIQTPTQDLRKTVASVQTYTLLRGIVLSGLLLLAAHPTAHVLGVGGSWLSLAVVSFSIVLSGLTNLQCYSVQREFDFRISNYMDLGSQIVAFLGAALGAAVWPDNRAIVASILFQSISKVLISHLVATHRLKFGFNRQVFKELSRFGVPLLFNGALIASTTNGDKFIIAMSDLLVAGPPISLAEFARYSICYNLIFTLINGLLRVATSVMLPTIVAHREDTSASQRKILKFAGIMSLYGGGLTIFFTFVGNFALKTVFGTNYTLDLEVLVLLTVSMSMRAMRTVPNAVSTAYGDTWNTLYSNILRTSAIPMSIIAIALGSGIEGVALVNCSAELLALALGSQLANRAFKTKPVLFLAFLRRYMPLAMLCLVWAGLSMVGHMSLPLTVIFFSATVLLLALINNDIVRDICANFPSITSWSNKEMSKVRQ